MSDRTKLATVSMAVMMLPYRIDLPVTLLVVTAILCVVLDIALESSGRRAVSRTMVAALALYRRLKYRPSPSYQSVAG